MVKAGLLAILTLGMLAFSVAACGRGGAPTGATPTQQSLATPASTAAGEPGSPQVETVGRVYKNRAFGYELALPAGWEVDERSSKGIVLRLPRKDFLVTVAVYESEDLPPAPATLAGFREAWLAVMKSVMPAFTVLKEGPATLGKDEALFYEYTWVDRGTKLWAKALLVRRPNYGYEVFGWVDERAWPEFSQVMDDILRTFKLE